MRLAVVALLAAFSVTSAFGIRHVGFEADAFNRVYPASYAKDFVFSPVSFELDCVIYAQALDTISKAAVAERMGAVAGFESIYQPVLADLSSRSNGMSFVAARGFCVPTLGKIAPHFKVRMAEDYGAMFCSLYPVKGAEAWFRAEMEGEMEDFKVAIDTKRDSRYAFYDLASVKASWLQPFPKDNTTRKAFTAGDGTKIEVEYMRDVRKGAFWVNSEFLLLNLPMARGCVFYALMPKKDAVDLSSVRAEFNSLEVENLLVATKSVTEKGVFNGVLDVSIPKISVCSRHDIIKAMMYFKVPTSKIRELHDVDGVREIAQCVRFELNENGVEVPEKRKPEPEHTIALNRQFMYFVYHEPTSTILVAGQFTGLKN